MTSRPLCPDPLTSAIGKAKQSSGLRAHPTPTKHTSEWHYSSPLLIFGIKFILKVRGLFKYISLSIQKLRISITLLKYSKFS